MQIQQGLKSGKCGQVEKAQARRESLQKDIRQCQHQLLQAQDQLREMEVINESCQTSKTVVQMEVRSCLNRLMSNMLC